VTPAKRGAAEDFVRYLLSEDGQLILRQYHLRAPDTGIGSSELAFRPFTVEDLGGWSKAYRDLIEGVWGRQIAPDLALGPLPSITNGED
jgi:ABC-type sulfate transport system substrate-binding protein